MMNTNRFEGTPFNNDDQLNFRDASEHAKSYKELEQWKREREVRLQPDSVEQAPKSPEALAAERVLTTGRFLESYRDNFLEEQEAA